MPTEYHWEYVKSIKAHDDNGRSYLIDQDQQVASLRPISGQTDLSKAGGKFRFMCGGEPVNRLSDRQYKLVRPGTTLTPDLPG
jgi:hypothetical protein